MMFEMSMKLSNCGSLALLDSCAEGLSVQAGLTETISGER